MWAQLKNSPRWSEYKAQHLDKFEDTVLTFNSPVIPYLWLQDNIQLRIDGGTGSWSTAKELFDKRVGDCEDYSTFITYCLLHNGFSDEFETHENNAACSLVVLCISGGDLAHGNL